jgi:hypothetical protein
MSGTNATVSRVTGTSTLVRPRFEPGMLLQHDDLEQVSSYTRELNRLMFRSLFGCGVVCGLVVKTDHNCGKDIAVIGAGLALDCRGDPIYVPSDEPIVINDDCDPNLESPLWVVLCRTSKRCAPRTAMCPSDEEETSSVCTRERDGYEIRIVRQKPNCICYCKPPIRQPAFASECRCVDPTLPCYTDHYAGICGCNCDESPGGSCDCDCILLATLNRDSERTPWKADHHLRRFVRPVLMRDPQVEEERTPADQQSTVIRGREAVSVQPTVKKRVGTPTTPKPPA